MAHYIGLMSGTSLDGVDAVLALAGTDGRLKAQAHIHLPTPERLRAELLALNQPGNDELHRAALAANQLMRVYADAVVQVLSLGRLTAAEVVALGAHGQTVRHRPGEFDGTGYTIQLVNGALLTELTGIDVVCDFRNRDVAACGQGAPLVPAFHAAQFATPGRDTAVLNIGGIANLTLLDAQGSVQGHDCGPGNVLMDLWCQRHRGQPFDANGTWASGGHVQTDLLNHLLDEPFVHRLPPKSTGRDLFNAGWLDKRLDGSEPQNVMATLTEYTAACAADALVRHMKRCEKLLICGGGALNADLLRRLRARLPPMVHIGSTAEEGVPADQVEGLAFAWLAAAFVARRASNLPAVTGAKGPRVLGALYPAR